MVRSYTVFTIGLCLGIAIGQKLIIHAYDPDILERNTLDFSAQAYYTGCMYDFFNQTNATQLRRQDCQKMSQKFYEKN
mgnify:CR=1 FL=1